MKSDAINKQRQLLDGRKSILAKLMATENIIVQHGNYPTAFFNVKDRVLGLPLWNDDKDLYDMLVGHEVGHALYTPQEGWIDAIEKEGLPHSLVNVCEDVRIERKMMDKFPGLLYSFTKAYRILNDRDFFGVVEKLGPDHGQVKRDSYNLIDRINLKAKLRGFIDVEFSEKENVLFDELKAADTFEEILVVARKIYDEMKDFFEKQKEQQQKMKEAIEKALKEGKIKPEDLQKGQGDGQGTPIKIEVDEEGNMEASTPTVDDLRGNGQDDEEEGEGNGKGELEEGEGESKSTQEHVEDFIHDSFMGASTQKNFSQKQQHELVQRGKGGNRLVVSQGLHPKQIEEVYYDHREVRASREAASVSIDSNRAKRFISQNKNAVGLLIKEFELRKNATMLARQSVAKTGSIDVDRLFSYRFTDDIFKRVASVPNAKNHGVVMMIDYSGSMEGVMNQVIGQMLVLSMFCKKARIPFSVFGFTSGWNQYNRHHANKYGAVGNFNDYVRHNGVRVFHILGSNMSKTHYRESFNYLADMALRQRYDGSSALESLGGTPLNESLMTMHQLCKEFRLATGVEKLTFITITDGDGQNVCINNVHHSSGDGIAVKIDKKYVPIEQNYSPYVSRAILNNMKESGVVDNTIAFDLTGRPRESRVGSLIINDPGSDNYGSKHSSPIVKEKIADFAKNGICMIKDTFGYDSYFMVRQDVSKLTVDAGKMKQKNGESVEKAFERHAKAKSGKKFLAKEFAKTIA